MAYPSKVLTILIASPGDVQAERDAIEQEILDWNRSGRSRAEGIVLLPLRWETDAIAELSSADLEAQEIINQQFAGCDILIAVFHSRLGTPTGRAVSGTAEEIEIARRAGLPVHVLVSQQPVPRLHDAVQLQALRDYERTLFAKGLVGGFASTENLRDIVRRTIESDLARFKTVKVVQSIALDTPRARIENLLSINVQLLKALRPKCEYRAIVTVRPDGAAFRLTYCYANLLNAPEKRHKLPYDFGVAGEAYTQGIFACANIPPGTAHLGSDGKPVEGIWQEIRCVIAWPLTLASGYVFGTLNIDSNATLSESRLSDARVQAALEQVSETIESELRPEFQNSVERGAA